MAKRAKVDASDYVPSLIRTYVPIGVGALAAWLAVKGLNVNPTTQVAITALATAVLSGAYYAVARVLETKFPALGFLLGHKAKPVYPETKKLV
jgi:hypothetical protein